MLAKRLTLTYTLLLCITCFELSAQKSPLWGNLEPGKYDVGFQILDRYDLSRPAISSQDIMGKVNGHSVAEGRQIQICVWYPAKEQSGKRMPFEDYIFESARELDFAPLSAAGKEAAIDQYIEQIYGGDKKFGRPGLQKFSALATAAIRNATAATGKFPVLVYPAYQPPASQSIMCEYLASHGYVVISTSMKGTSSNLPEISVTGIESQVNDLSFILSVTKELPFVDGNKISVAAVGFNATSCLAWLTRNPEIDSFISLDGGILVINEKRMLQLTPFYDPSVIRKPMMLIHTTHPDVNPATIDDYKYADKYFVHFLTMRESDFANYGMLESFSPGIVGTPKGDTKAGFEWASRYVLNFLDFTLKADLKAKTFISNQPGGNQVPAGIMEATAKPALPQAPTLYELKVLIADRGLEGLTASYNALKEKDRQPFSQKLMTDLFNWLGYLRDTDANIRAQLLKIWLESYPNSAKGHFLSARISSIRGDVPLARTHYEEALKLLEFDPDPFLDNNTRIRIRTVATEELSKK